MGCGVSTRSEHRMWLNRVANPLWEEAEKRKGCVGTAPGFRKLVVRPQPTAGRQDLVEPRCTTQELRPELRHDYMVYGLRSDLPDLLCKRRCKESSISPSSSELALMPRRHQSLQLVAGVSTDPRTKSHAASR